MLLLSYTSLLSLPSLLVALVMYGVIGNSIFSISAIDSEPRACVSAALKRRRKRFSLIRGN